MSQISNRDYYFDFIRAIGLISIILVHCTSNDFILRLNLFNVPLMVFVSGLVAYRIPQNDILKYYWKRLKRLLIPTYIFICCFLVFLYIIKFCGIADLFDFSYKKILYSFLLLDQSYGGIGFVWIIRVFLLMTFACPFVVFLRERLNNFTYFTLLLLIILLQYFLCKIDIPDVQNNIFYSQYILYTVGYLPFLMGGVKLKQCSIVVYISFISMLIGLLLIVRITNSSNHFLNLTHKYPPRFDYIAYGLIISTTLIMLRKVLNRLSMFTLFRYIGGNTMWIYWWHVPIVLTFNSILGGTRYWPLSFLATASIACLLYYIQY